MLDTCYQTRQAEVVRMALQTPVGTGRPLEPVPVAEHPARATRGVKVLAAGVAAVLAGVALLWYAHKQTGGTTTALVWAGVLVLIIAVLGLAGLTPVAPGQARVIQLFGKYRGTVRESGMQWVNPFTHRIKVSTRIRNHETAQAKVNDVVGARMTSVEGAVGMVRLALRRLEEEDVVALDEERKAAMVSNLLVVLCSEQATQQVVNTGSLYQ